MAEPREGESVLARVVRIFETFESDAPALRVSDIARRAGLHVATASRLVDELVEVLFVERLSAPGAVVNITRDYRRVTTVTLFSHSLRIG